MSNETFSVIDYTIFVFTLSASAIIGIYFGCFGSRNVTANEYLYGVGNIKAIPIGLSLYSSAVSAVTILGMPSEIYTFGGQYFMVYLGVGLSLFVLWTFILPVFCGNLQLSSAYEVISSFLPWPQTYLERRFNYKVRILSSSIYILQTQLYIPIVLYACTLGFSQSTNIPIYICTTVIGGVCVFYTMLGGFSAVIWSDAFQATLMFGACVCVMIKGVSAAGGFSEMWHRAESGDRTKFFNMDLNPFQRATFWSAIFGSMIGHAAHSGCGASSIQRYMALRNEKQARISTLVGITSIILFSTIICFIGLTMYAKYSQCDPIKNHEIDNGNKLLSFYVAQLFNNVPGFSGFFNAGLLCAGLSTISAELNTTSGLIYHCYIKKIFKKIVDGKNGTIIMKIVVLLNGLYCILVIPAVKNSSHIMSLTLKIGGITSGTKLGIMLLGAAFPQCSSLGVMCGALSGIAVVSWISVGAMIYDETPKYMLETSTESCSTTLNYTHAFDNRTETDSLAGWTTTQVPTIYKLSFMYYPVVGIFVTLLVSLFVSYVTGKNDRSKMDQNLFIPYLRQKCIKQAAEEEVMLNNIKHECI